MTSLTTFLDGRVVNLFTCNCNFLAASAASSVVFHKARFKGNPLDPFYGMKQVEGAIPLQQMELKLSLSHSEKKILPLEIWF